jgi:hypothetical protein
MFKRDDVMTTRPSSTSLLTIDSEDRFNGDYTISRTVRDGSGPNANPYNFTINKAESLMNGFFTRLAVTEVVMNWAVPNINIKSSSIIVRGYDSLSAPVSYTITIPQGFYTPKELAAALQSAIRSGGGGNFNGALITYGTNGFPAFAYAKGASVTTSMWFLPLDYNTAAYPYPSTTKQLFDVLGFTENNTFPVSSNGFGTTSFAQWCRYVDIVSPQLTYNQPLKDTTSQPIARDSLCRVYLDQTTGAFNQNIANLDGDAFTPTGCTPFVIYRNFTLPKQISWTPNQPVGQLTFQVFDDTGALLSEVLPVSSNFSNVPTAADWAITLQVSEN